MSDQLSFADALPPLRLNDQVRVIATGRTGVIAQVWPGRDRYAVFSREWSNGYDTALPSFCRDELELIEERSNGN